MRPIKLLSLTSRNYLVIFAVLALFFFFLLFTIIQREVFHSIDEVLYNRKVKVLEEIAQDGNKILADSFRYSEFSLTHVQASVASQDIYSDTVIYVSVDKEWDEFRKLTCVVEIGGKFYKFETVAARLETHEIISSVTNSLVVIFLLMVTALFFATRVMSKKLWKPFYKTISALNNFEIDKNKSLNLGAEKIEEFDNLNKSIEDLARRSMKVYENQKQFIENASHEMQTPLAITQSKLEQLIADPNLTEEQSRILQTLSNSTQRISRLNKTLLLLSKIENQQFFDKESIAVAAFIEEILTLFDEQREALEIKVSCRIDPDSKIQGNRVLVDLLVTNLLKNALVHNLKGGEVDILFSGGTLSVSNTSGGGEIPATQLYQRFYKNSARKDSWGLGLAIVKKICAINQWPIDYRYESNAHFFRILFQS